LDTDPAVAIYVDGQYQTVNSINLESLVGVDSIEVLRGPQGTLFGRNAFACAITIATKNPSGQSDGEVGVTVGIYGRKNRNAVLDFIVTDALSGRVDLGWINSTGFYTNVLDNNRPIGGDANLTIRPTFVLKVGDLLRFQFKYNFVGDQSGPTPLSASWHNLAPKVSLDYQWTPDTMLYVTWSRGFKAGGFQALASTASAAGPYGDETMDATEMGIKSLFWEHRARISADAFYESIDGLQRSVVFLENGISNNLTRNAANSVSKGLEMEAAFLPVDALTIRANAGYLDAYYTIFCADFVATNASRPACGNQSGEVDNTNLVPSNAPRWTMALTGEYRTPVGDIGALDLHIDEAYATSLWTADDNNPISYRAPQALLNAAIRFSAADDRYSVSIWGRNLTDRIVTEFGVTAYPLFSLWNPTPPRSFGVTLAVKLGRRSQH
jgi:outer membrane receptor protein involved in Fe transport